MNTKTNERKTITVVPGEKPPAAEVLAQSIVDIATATKALYNTRLNEKALLMLISHAAGVSQRDVKAVLAAMWHLEATYLKPRK